MGRLDLPPMLRMCRIMWNAQHVTTWDQELTSVNIYVLILLKIQMKLAYPIYYHRWPANIKIIYKGRKNVSHITSRDVGMVDGVSDVTGSSMGKTTAGKSPGTRCIPCQCSNNPVNIRCLRNTLDTLSSSSSTRPHKIRSRCVREGQYAVFFDLVFNSKFSDVPSTVW